MNVFNAAIKSHEQWKILLKRHIDLGNILDPHEVVNCHACELGKWIYGQGLRFNGLPSFEAVCINHEVFHRAAAEVVRHSNAGDKAKALSLLKPNGVFSQTSSKLVHALKECVSDLAHHIVKDTRNTGKVIDILSSEKANNIYSVAESTTVLDALKYMVDHKIGSLVVYKDKQFLGIFTERGFATNFAYKGTNFLSSPISEVLDSDVVNISAYDSIEEAMTLMTTTHNRHLPVIENDNLIGIVSIGDVIKHIVSEDHVTLLELDSYIYEADSA